MSEDTQKQRQARMNQRKMQIFRGLKTGESCVDCNIFYPHYVLQYDHVDGKTCGVETLRHASLERLLEELAKCDLVCANCHSIRTWQRKQGNSIQRSPAERAAVAARREVKARSLLLEASSPDSVYGLRSNPGPNPYATSEMLRILRGEA